jgi:hypothetical protein
LDEEDNHYAGGVTVEQPVERVRAWRPSFPGALCMRGVTLGHLQPSEPGHELGFPHDFDVAHLVFGKPETLIDDHRHREGAT